ncbi:ATP-binding cassette domain-containing protein [Sphingomonas aerolata]|uniref:ATP-binding cassette domain-containing protein n=1 Tax=Sphingomonas aerolata TaxID=185951 RepID=UPI002FE35193
MTTVTLSPFTNQHLHGNHRVSTVFAHRSHQQHNGVAGGNGAGKSTTLSALLGYVRADAGEIAVCGIDPGAGR